MGSLAAWIALHESLTLLTIVGGLVVLAATAVIAVREGRRQPDSPEPLAPDPAGG